MGGFGLAVATILTVGFFVGGAGASVGAVVAVASGVLVGSGVSVTCGLGVKV